MEQYVSKSALVAEIEKRKNSNQEICTAEGSGAYYEDGFILDIINSLEVKDVELNMFVEQKQQWIEKACEWLKNELTYPTMTQAGIDWCQTLIAQFKNAMEEL